MTSRRPACSSGNRLHKAVASLLVLVVLVVMLVAVCTQASTTPPSEQHSSCHDTREAADAAAASTTHPDGSPANIPPTATDEVDPAFQQRIPPFDPQLEIVADKQRNEALHRYLAWLHQRGQWSSKLTLGHADGRLTVHAAHDLKAGEVVLEQRGECVITGEQVLTNPDLKQLEQHLRNGDQVYENLALVVYHLKESAKNNSLYAPYYDYLPLRPPGYMHWTEEVAQLVAGTSIADIHRNRDEYFRSKFAFLDKEIFSQHRQLFGQPITYQEFLRWCRIIATQIPHDTQVTTLPCGPSLLRHANKGARVAVENGVARVTLRTDVKAGDEIFVEYFPSAAALEVGLSYDLLPEYPLVSFHLSKYLQPVGSLLRFQVVHAALPETIILGTEEGFTMLLANLRLNALMFADIGSMNATINPFDPVSVMSEYRALRSGMTIMNSMIGAQPSLDELQQAMQQETDPLKKVLRSAKAHEVWVLKQAMRKMREKWYSLLD